MRIAPVAVGLLFTALVGCKKPDADAATVDAAAAANAMPPASSSSAASATKPASGPTGAAGKVLDSPPWPAGKSPEIKLTWAVYPTVGQGETSTRKLELVARSGEVARRFPVGAIKGALLPLNQSVCGDKQVAYKKTPGEVAKITFYVGGASTFAVRRSSPGMLEVESVQGADGYCPNNDCDTKSLLVKIPIPDDARIVEAISDIEAAGKEAPFDCSKGASSGAAACKAPEVAAYEMETFKPICAVPCKVNANCTAPQTCVLATKSSEPTMGMAAALKNEIYVCAAPKAPRPASSGLPRPRSSSK
jgi:hypothetical protein